jgi:pimeloyl-ACP methyl ester carboxylesterase
VGDRGALLSDRNLVETSVEVLGETVSVWKQGAGEPLVVLHDDLGRGEWSGFLEELAARFSVVAPAMPGFPPSSVPEWMRSVPQLASMMHQVLEKAGVGQCPVVGLGFGAWVAAEMQVQCSSRFSRMVLSGPMGLKPTSGEIVDRFLFTEESWVEMGFADPEKYVTTFGDPDEEVLLKWEGAREMTTRVAWKPYMFDRALPHLLAGVSTPTLVVWGEGDVIVPRSCVERYVEVLANATLRTVADGGHRLELECPSELAGLVTDFVGVGEVR